MKAGKSWDRSTTQEPTRVQKKLTRMNDQAAHKGIIFLFLKKKWEFFWENANTTMPFLRFWHLPKSRKAGKSWDRLDVEIYNPTAYASAKKTYANECPGCSQRNYFLFFFSSKEMRVLLGFIWKKQHFLAFHSFHLKKSNTF